MIGDQSPDIRAVNGCFGQEIRLIIGDHVIVSFGGAAVKKDFPVRGSCPETAALQGSSQGKLAGKIFDILRRNTRQGIC